MMTCFNFVWFPQIYWQDPTICQSFSFFTFRLLLFTPLEFSTSVLADVFFTGVWVTASLLKSPGLFSVFWPILIILSFRGSPLVHSFLSPPNSLSILWRLYRAHRLQLVSPSPSRSIVFSVSLQGPGTYLFFLAFFQLVTAVDITTNKRHSFMGSYIWTCLGCPTSKLWHTSEDNDIYYTCWYLINRFTILLLSGTLKIQTKSTSDKIWDLYSNSKNSSFMHDVINYKGGVLVV